MSFWELPSGKKITGSAEDAFLPSFSTIPDGTMAIATIKSFEVVNKEATQYQDEQKFIEIKFKLVDGDFKNREVSQKIKVFQGKPEQVERNLNMLKLVMDLCGYKPTHNNEPTTEELSTMCGKVLGIKIREWSMPKHDGGFMEGNHVSEVWSSVGFVCETGVKMEVTHTPNSGTDSALTRNSRSDVDLLDQDLPF